MPLSKPEEQFCTYLIEKHGDNYKVSNLFSTLEMMMFIPLGNFQWHLQAPLLNPDIQIRIFISTGQIWRSQSLPIHIIPICKIQILLNPDRNLGSTSVLIKQSGLYYAAPVSSPSGLDNGIRFTRFTLDSASKAEMGRKLSNSMRKWSLSNYHAKSLKVTLNPFNAEATFLRSTMMQIFLKTI